MTKTEYKSWLDREIERTNRAVEPSSMLGLAGEIHTISIQQGEINETAIKKLQVIEEERKTLSTDPDNHDFHERQEKLLDKLDAIRHEEE